MSRRVEYDPRTPIGMLAAMVERHPAYNWHPDARAAAELHTQQLVDDALRYTFNGARLPSTDTHDESTTCH
jgi:hypothetical protein